MGGSASSHRSAFEKKESYCLNVCFRSLTHNFEEIARLLIVNITTRNVKGEKEYGAGKYEKQEFV